MKPEFKAHQCQWAQFPSFKLSLDDKRGLKLFFRNENFHIHNENLPNLSCPVPEAPPPKDGLHFHIFPPLFTTMLLAQAVTMIWLEDLGCQINSCDFPYYYQSQFACMLGFYNLQDNHLLFCSTSRNKIFKAAKKTLFLSFLMIYSGSFSVAKISAHRPALSRIIPTPGKCSFSSSHGYVQRGSPRMVLPGDFLCFFFCCFKKDLFLTPMGMSQEHGKIRKGACDRPWDSVMDPSEHQKGQMEWRSAQTISGTTVQVSSEHFFIQVVHSAR